MINLRPAIITPPPVAAFSRRLALLATVRAATRPSQEQLSTPTRRSRPVADCRVPPKKNDVELIIIMLMALEKEHDFLCALEPYIAQHLAALLRRSKPSTSNPHPHRSLGCSQITMMLDVGEGARLPLRPKP